MVGKQIHLKATMVANKIVKKMPSEESLAY